MKTCENAGIALQVSYLQQPLHKRLDVDEQKKKITTNIQNIETAFAYDHFFFKLLAKCTIEIDY